MWHATTNRSTVFVTCRPAATISKKSYRWSLERRLPLRPRSLEAGGNWRISKPTIDRIDADIFESFRLTVLYVYIFGTQEAETYDHLHFFLYIYIYIYIQSIDLIFSVCSYHICISTLFYWFRNVYALWKKGYLIWFRYGTKHFVARFIPHSGIVGDPEIEKKKHHWFALLQFHRHLIQFEG